jgi:hypothetical protein
VRLQESGYRFADTELGPVLREALSHS